MTAKGDQPSDGAMVARLLKGIRPLSLINTDANIFARSLAVAAEGRIASWPFHIQRGFVRGRQLIDNIVGIETLAMNASMSPTNRVAMLFFGFAAALSIGGARCHLDRVARASRAGARHSCHPEALLTN